MSKKKVAFAILLVLIIMVSFSAVVATSFLNINGIAFVEHTNNVQVVAYERTDFWGRSAMTDLPSCFSRTDFVVSNLYLTKVYNSYLSVSVDESFVGTSIGDLSPGHTITTGFGITSEYEDYKNFGSSHPIKTILTSNSPTSDNFIYSTSFHDFYIKFPRYVPYDYAKLYITPNNPTVIEVQNNIIGSPRWFFLCNWVALNIRYKYDTDVYGVGDYWQLSTETLGLRTGDCEDFSILLCSLYRASGYDENSVFVLVGPTNDLGKVIYGDVWHAWVRINIGGLWTDIDPQDPTVVLGMLMNFALFDGVYQFNDVSFTRLK